MGSLQGAAKTVTPKDFLQFFLQSLGISKQNFTDIFSHLVLELVTIYLLSLHFSKPFRSTQPGHLFLGSCIEYTGVILEYLVPHPVGGETVRKGII